ncbi:unnamed protein product, partial [Meganyctiphanes norvegica]
VDDKLSTHIDDRLSQLLEKKLSNHLEKYFPAVVETIQEVVAKQNSGKQEIMSKLADMESNLEDITEKIEQEPLGETLVSTSVLLQNGSCPFGFEEYGTCCYFFSENIGEQLSWEAARTYCQNLGNSYDLPADLAEVGTYRCGDIKLMEAIGNLKYSAWIGARYSDAEDIWLWEHSRQNLSMKNSFWRENEPDSTDYDCLLVNKYGTYERTYFIDQPCYASATFVCQIF